VLDLPVRITAVSAFALGVGAAIAAQRSTHRQIIKEIGRLRMAERDHAQAIEHLDKNLGKLMRDARWQGYASALADQHPPARLTVVGSD